MDDREPGPGSDSLHLSTRASTPVDESRFSFFSSSPRAVYSGGTFCTPLRDGSLLTDRSFSVQRPLPMSVSRGYIYALLRPHDARCSPPRQHVVVNRSVSQPHSHNPPPRCAPRPAFVSSPSSIPAHESRSIPCCLPWSSIVETTCAATQRPSSSFTAPGSTHASPQAVQVD